MLLLYIPFSSQGIKSARALVRKLLRSLINGAGAVCCHDPQRTCPRIASIVKHQLRVNCDAIAFHEFAIPTRSDAPRFRWVVVGES